MPMPVAPSGYTVVTNTQGWDTFARLNNSSVNSLLRCDRCAALVQGADGATLHTKNHNRSAQVVSFPIPAFTLAGGASDTAIIWPLEMLRSDYLILPPVVDTTLPLLTKVKAVVKAGSQTTKGCTITVSANGLVALGAGGTIYVNAVGSN